MSVSINLGRLGVGGIIFLIGALIYVINFVISLFKSQNSIPVDGVGLMVLGIGVALILRW
jgi:hypothetical protein